MVDKIDSFIKRNKELIFLHVIDKKIYTYLLNSSKDNDNVKNVQQLHNKLKEYPNLILFDESNISLTTLSFIKEELKTAYIRILHVENINDLKKNSFKTYTFLNNLSDAISTPEKIENFAEIIYQDKDMRSLFLKDSLNKNIIQNDIKYLRDTSILTSRLSVLIYKLHYLKNVYDSNTKIGIFFSKYFKKSSIYNNKKYKIFNKRGYNTKIKNNTKNSFNNDSKEFKQINLQKNSEHNQINIQSLLPNINYIRILQTFYKRWVYRMDNNFKNHFILFIYCIYESIENIRFFKKNKNTTNFIIFKITKKDFELKFINEKIMKIVEYKKQGKSIVIISDRKVFLNNFIYTLIHKYNTKLLLLSDLFYLKYVKDAELFPIKKQTNPKLSTFILKKKDPVQLLRNYWTGMFNFFIFGLIDHENSKSKYSKSLHNNKKYYLENRIYLDIYLFEKENLLTSRLAAYFYRAVTFDFIMSDTKIGLYYRQELGVKSKSKRIKEEVFKVYSMEKIRNIKEIESFKI